MRSKRCSRCKKLKPVGPHGEFHSRGTSRDGYGCYCKSCRAAYVKSWRRGNSPGKVRWYARVKERRRELGQAVAALKAGPCADCRGRFSPWQMQFDHLRDKDQQIARMVANGHSLERIKREIRKCDLVCANCHADRTYKRLHGLLV